MGILEVICWETAPRRKGVREAGRQGKKDKQGCGSGQSQLQLHPRWR